MSRGGRKGNPNAKRRQSTRLERSPLDHGTPELLMHRLKDHGMPNVGIDYALDALAAKGLLCPQLTKEPEGDWMARNVIARDTGAKLYSLHRALHGRSTAGAVDPNAHGRSTDVHETPKDVRMEAEYCAMRQALQRLGRRTFDATMNIAVYGRKLPPADVRPRQHAAELAALQDGLATLVDLPPVRMQRAA